MKISTGIASDKICFGQEGIYFVICHLVSSANSSDSEELSAGESLSKSQPAKSVSTGMKSHQTKSPARTQSPGKCGKNGEKESDLKEQNNRLPKVYKWSFQMCKYFLQNTPSVVLEYRIRGLAKFCGFFAFFPENYSILSLLNFVTNPDFIFFVLLAIVLAVYLQYLQAMLLELHFLKYPTFPMPFLDTASALTYCSCHPVLTSHSGMNVTHCMCCLC